MAVAQDKSRLTRKTRPGPDRSRVLTLRKKLGVPQRIFARMMSISERSLAKFEKGQPLSDATQRQLTETTRLHEALAKVMQPKAIGRWFQEPNPAFDGLKPLEVIERGQIDLLWAMIYDLESGAVS